MADESTQELDISTHPNPSIMWRTRRRLTVGAGIWGIIEMLLLFFVVPVEKINALTGPIESSLYVIGLIISAYIGFKAFTMKGESKR